MGETSKARERRWLEGWYDKYIRSPGIDIGGGLDCLDAKDFLNYDINWSKSGDANFMADVKDETYNTVYASHILEHMEDPVTAIKNWFRILKKDGYMIISVPHRDLYEKKKTLPSRWNPEHKTYWLPVEEEPPVTKSLLKTVMEAVPQAKLVSLYVADRGFNYLLPEDVHSVGEYSIEMIVKK